MERTERFLDTAAGRIHCVEQGAGEPLVLVHSNGCSWHEYEQVLPLLAARFRCIAWDLPGHGDSERSTKHLSIADYARATLGVMDAMGLDRAHVCGASVGGFVCMALGNLAAQRVGSLLIVEAALRTAAEWRREWPRIEAQFALARQAESEVAPRFRQLTPDLLKRWNIDRAKAGGWRMVDVMWAICEFDAMGELAALRVPCAVIVGDKGPVIGGRERYRQALPSAPLAVIGNAGHFPMIDDPDAFARAVVDGIGQVSPAG